MQKYKNKNWVEIWDLINVREVIFGAKKMVERWGGIRMKIGLKMSEYKNQN